MGRCNNRRVQQQAQEMRNVPSRARFSRPPPFLSSSRRKNAGGEGGSGGPSASSSSSKNSALANRVVSSRSARQQPSTQSCHSRPPDHAGDSAPWRTYRGGNVKDLDVIELSDESVDRIYQLLSSLGVIQNDERGEGTITDDDNDIDDDDEGNAWDDEDDDDDTDSAANDDGVDHGNDRHYHRYRREPPSNWALVIGEYDDEYDERDAAIICAGGVEQGPDGSAQEWKDAVWEGATIERKTTTTTSRNCVGSEGVEVVESDPAYRYLTAHLSFSCGAARRALRAVEKGWKGGASLAGVATGVVAPPTSAATPSAPIVATPAPSTTTSSSSSPWKDRLGLALDWLALHLQDSEITAGFCRRANPGSDTLFRSSRCRSVDVVAVSHPSISVATKLTEDSEFLRQARIDDRAVGFVQLGFLYSDVVEALAAQEEEGKGDDRPSSAPPGAIDDEATLRLLLTKLEQEMCPDSAAFSVKLIETVDKDALVTARMEEVEVLTAVYDTDFEVVSSRVAVDGDLMGRYTITLSELATATLSKSLSRAQIEDEPAGLAKLHVFLRPGYPEVEPPLFLVTCPQAEGQLLRRINMALIRHAAVDADRGGGCPCVFEVATFLAENLESIAAAYSGERRSDDEELEGELRLRLASGMNRGDMYDSATKVDRHMAARMKAEERAHDFQRKQEMLEKERREQEGARLERINEQNRFIRHTLADKELDRRERQRHDEGARRASRAAMLSALNAGATTAEARARADSAELTYMTSHGLAGVADSGANGEDPAVEVEHHAASGAARDDDPNHVATVSTATSAPRTQAFMERLRALYNNAAEHKGMVRLEASDLKSGSSTRLPRPIALPVGDLARVIADVVSVQREQPWLVNAAEARVPTLEATTDLASGNADRTLVDPDALSISLKRAMEDKLSSRQYEAILRQRRKLPAYKAREELVRTIANNQVTVVSGETGCGKSICTPQFVLDDMILRNMGSQANIIVTQPRRISAVGVAERIAFERLESVGDTCGYSIKLERKASSRTRLLLCTTGILLRRLQCDPDLASVSHVFVDEVHERDLNTDFILIIFKELLKRRPSLKLVLMSATLNAESFVRFFPESATISIPGRSHPVREYRLEDALQHTGFEIPENSDYAKKNVAGKRDGITKKELRRLYPNYRSSVIKSLEIVDESVINYELLAQLLLYIVETEGDGAVLVFLPGIVEISKALDEIRRIEKFQSPAFRIYPLHSSLSTSDQVSVFEVPPRGVRKIVLASNIAETSITIEDVVFVVDSGRVKENRRDEVKETPALVECWVSRASAKQRRGRAGRVRPGVAYHLFSSHTHNHVLQEHQLPEILRVGLEDIVLQILTLDLGEPSKFLASAIDPPSALAMKNALRLLESLGAVECAWKNSHTSTDKENDVLCSSRCDELDASTELTALGFHLSSLPVDPRVGKMMIYGALFGCVDSTLTIAAAMTCTKPLFTSPIDQRDVANEARRAMSVEGSDHLTLLSAFNEWKRLRKVKGGKAAQIYANENFLSRTTLFQMEDLRRHFAGLLEEVGFLPKGFKLACAGHHSPTSSDSVPENLALLRALLCAGLYPNVIISPRSLVTGSGQETAGDMAFKSQSKGDVFLHPCTVSFSASKLSSRYFCFYEIVRTSKLFVRDLTPVNPLALLLFGGAIEGYPREGVITIDDWLRFRVTSKPASSHCVPARRVALIKHLRFQLEAILLQKIISPTGNDMDSRPIVDAITGLLSEQDSNVAKLQENKMIRPFNVAPAQSRRNQGNHLATIL